MKQVILSLNLKAKGEQVILVTEETESSNDNKLFKKIPAICKEVGIKTMTLPELIVKYDGIDIEFLIQYWGMKSALETAVEEREIEIAQKAIKKGFDDETIADLTNLPIEQIAQLRSETKKNG